MCEEEEQQQQQLQMTNENTRLIGDDATLDARKAFEGSDIEASR